MHWSRGRSVHLLHESAEYVALHCLIDALLGRAEVVQHDLAHLVVWNTASSIGYSDKSKKIVNGIVIPIINFQVTRT